RPPIFQGPFDWKVRELKPSAKEKRPDKAAEGPTLVPLDSPEDPDFTYDPLIEEHNMDTTLSRMYLPSRRRQQGPPPGMTRPRPGPPPPGMSPPPGQRP